MLTSNFNSASNGLQDGLPRDSGRLACQELLYMGCIIFRSCQNDFSIKLALTNRGQRIASFRPMDTATNKLIKLLFGL